jgi:hypothetical protein
VVVSQTRLKFKLPFLSSEARKLFFFFLLEKHHSNFDTTITDKLLGTIVTMIKSFRTYLLKQHGITFFLQMGKWSHLYYEFIPGENAQYHLRYGAKDHPPHFFDSTCTRKRQHVVAIGVH